MYRYSALLNYQCLYPQTYWHKENGKGPSMTKLIRGQFGRSTWTRTLDLGMDIKEEIVLEGIIWSEVLYRCDMWVSTKDHQVWTCALGQPDELLSSYIVPVCQDCIILLSLSWYSQDLEQHGLPQCKAVPCKWTRAMTQFGIILCFLHFSCSTSGCLALNFLHCTHEQFLNWNLNNFCFKFEWIIRSVAGTFQVISYHSAV